MAEAVNPCRVSQFSASTHVEYEGDGSRELARIWVRPHQSVDFFFGHREIPPAQLLVLWRGNGGAVLIHPLFVETSKAAIASCRINCGVNIWLSNLRSAFAEFDDGDAAVVGSSVPDVVFEDGCVDVCHDPRKRHSGIIEQQK